MKINPNDPAFPVSGAPGVSQDYPGFPIRLEIAARVMAGWAANERLRGRDLVDNADYCLSIADALIAAYNESEGD